MELQGYVVRITPYKENNSMITVLTNEGITSFLSRGNLAISSKNTAALSLYAESQFEIIESKSGHLSLKVGQVINAHEAFFGNLIILACLSLVGEVLIKCLDEENAPKFYVHFSHFFTQLEQGGNPLTATLVFIIKSLEAHGLTFLVDQCISCTAKKDIVAFSYLDGGFICSRCFDMKRHQSFGKTYLQVIRYLFANKEEALILKELPLREVIQVMEELINILNEQLGIQIKGANLVYKIIR